MGELEDVVGVGTEGAGRAPGPSGCPDQVDGW